MKPIITYAPPVHGPHKQIAVFGVVIPAQLVEEPKRSFGIISVRAYSDKRLLKPADPSKVPGWHRIDVTPATLHDAEITTFYFHV